MKESNFFKIKVTGRQEDIDEFAQILFDKNPQRKFPDVWAANAGMLDEATRTQPAADTTGLASHIFSGLCKHSIRTSLCEQADKNAPLGDWRRTSIEEETRRLDLVAEAFSESSYYEFQEHLTVAFGKVIINECVDYYEWPENEFLMVLDEAGADFEPARKFGIDYSNYHEFMNRDGMVIVGGLEHYMRFEDQSARFEERTHGTMRSIPRREDRGTLSQEKQPASELRPRNELPHTQAAKKQRISAGRPETRQGAETREPPTRARLRRRQAQQQSQETVATQAPVLDEQGKRLFDCVDLIANNDACALLKVRQGCELDLIKMGCFDGDETMFRVKKDLSFGKEFAVSIFYEERPPHSIMLGSAACVNNCIETAARDAVCACVTHDFCIALDEEIKPAATRKHRDIPIEQARAAVRSREKSEPDIAAMGARSEVRSK